MRIIIDARMLYWTGVGRYTKALLDNLPDIDGENEYVVLMRPEDKKLWQPVAPNLRIVEASINPYTPAEQLRLPRLLGRLNPDLVHFITPNGPVLYQGKKVVTVHDLTLLDYDTSRGTGLSKWLRGCKRLPFRLIFWWNVWRADGITVGAQYVKDQLVRRFRVNKERISVVPLAFDPQLAAPEPTDKFVKPDEDYLLYVGNFYPYKNVGVVIEALKLLGAKYPSLKLVIVGQPDYFRDELERQTQQLGVSGRVVFTGFVTNGELVSLYKGAKLYVYPSLSEGFGLQGLEAMGLGLPVLAAQASCLPEVYSDAAVYFDPHNAKDLAEKVSDLLGNEAMREKMREAGYQRVKQFSWQKMARETHAAYMKVLKDK